MPDKFYGSKIWKDLRLRRLRLDDWRCQSCGVVCGGAKRGQPSPHVDHIEPRRVRPDLALDINNLRTLCGKCHNTRTRMDQIGQDKPEIGPDGYPLC